MSRFTPITLAAVAVLALGAVAADAATDAVGPQQTYAGKTAPVSIAGNSLHKGTRLPSGAKLVYRTVSLKSGERAKLTLTVPKGMGITGFGESGNFRLKVPAKTSTWVDHRRITVVVYAHGGDASGRFYALARP